MTDELHPGESPDWPIELAEPVAKLGRPNAVFRIPRQHAARKAFSGVALIIGGAIANYIYYGVLNGPVEIHVLHFVLISPVLTGFGLLYAAWRDRGLWVLVYPMGILRWQRGIIVTFPWNEIVELLFYRVVECQRPRRTKGPNGEIIKSWLPIAKMGSRSLGAHLTLRRFDGAEAILPSSLSEFPNLCQIVQEESFQVMWPRVWEQFLAGKRTKFGVLSISLDGIHRDGDFLPWYELDDALVQNGKLIIRSRVLRKPWIELPLQNVLNPHLFVALLIIGPPKVREVEPA
jgi:hypothetical protein